MQLEYSTYSNQNIIDICLNTYGSMNMLSKCMKDNNIRNVLYNPQNNTKFVFDDTLIKNRIIYNLGKTYATNQITDNTSQNMATKRLTFRIGTDKPNGNTVQDDLLKQSEVLLVFIGGSEVNEHFTGFPGYTFNKSTGTLDLTNIGGVSNIILDILYS